MKKTEVESKVRSISKITDSLHAFEGGGFQVQRPFPSHSLRNIDPFILLDEMGPTDYGPGEAKGAPDHPHRGFETVTYVLSGKMQHKDSYGHSGIIGPGDVQWMTAGSGVVHSEMPEERFSKTGGKMHGFQLWVNLPKKDKMKPPSYQEFPSERIPIGQSDDGKVWVRVVAGEALGAKAVIETRTPIIYLHYILQPQSEIIQQVPHHYNVFAYVIDGDGIFGFDKKLVKDGQIATFNNDGDKVTITNNGNVPLSLLLIGGVPLNEPVVQMGTFVMNTKKEIEQAIEDYQSGRMGKIDF